MIMTLANQVAQLTEQNAGLQKENAAHVQLSNTPRPCSKTLKTIRSSGMLLTNCRSDALLSIDTSHLIASQESETSTLTAIEHRQILWYFLYLCWDRPRIGQRHLKRSVRFAPQPPHRRLSLPKNQGWKTLLGFYVLHCFCNYSETPVPIDSSRERDRKGFLYLSVTCQPMGSANNERQCCSPKAQHIFHSVVDIM